MGLFQSLKTWLGVARADQAQPLKTAKDLLSEHAQNLPEESRKLFFVESLPKLKAELEQKLETLSGQSSGVDKERLARVILEEASAMHYAATEAEDADHKTWVLVAILKICRTWAKPGSEAAHTLGMHLREFEEKLLSGEAAGDYQVVGSERRRWITWPLAKGDGKHPAHGYSVQQLQKIFVPIPEIELFDFEHTVPGVFISSEEALALFSEKEVGLFYIPDKNMYLTYIY